MPRYKFLAVITDIPIIREISGLVYDKILAPILYKTHLNRVNKNSNQS
jgi:hypothetical protein